MSHARQPLTKQHHPGPVAVPHVLSADYLSDGSPAGLRRSSPSKSQLCRRSVSLHTTAILDQLLASLTTTSAARITSKRERERAQSRHSEPWKPAKAELLCAGRRQYSGHQDDARADHSGGERETDALVSRWE